MPYVYVAHKAETHQMRGLGIYRGADIYHHDRPFYGRKQDRDARTLDAFKAPQRHYRRADKSRGVTRRDDRVDLALFGQVGRHTDRRVFLRAGACRARLMHADDFGRMMHSDARRDRADFRKFVLYPRLVPDYDDLKTVFGSGKDSALDNSLRCVIASHAVNGYPHFFFSFFFLILMTLRPL